MRATLATVFCIALALRLLYLLQSATSPTFLVPIVDAGSYDSLARELARGELSGRLFYQGSFYPLFLALVYKLGAGSVVAAKVVQAIVGAFTCVLTTLLGGRLFGARVGFAAGLVTALHAPLFFFDGQLLATGWAAFWCVALLLAVLSAEERPGVWRFAAFGVTAALATITRATFLPFIVFCGFWLLLRARPRSRSRRERIGLAFALLLGFASIAAPISLLNESQTEQFSPLPHSGGLNLYIGNNPNREETTATRPADFYRITSLPQHHDLHGAGANQRFFTERVIAYAVDEPASFVSGLFAKTLEFLSPRELPRNVDVYVFRSTSSLLSAGVWKLGGWGFPSGVLIPLALLGMILCWQRLPLPVIALPLLSAASIIGVFVSARYRVALTPVIAILACAAVAQLLVEVGTGRHARAATWLAATTITSALLAIAGPFAQEETNYDVELNYSVGTEWLERARELRDTGETTQSEEAVERARSFLTRALELDPTYAPAHANLGLLALRSGNADEANTAFARALRFDPRNSRALEGRVSALHSAGRAIEAARQLREAERIRSEIRAEALAR